MYFYSQWCVEQETKINNNQNDQKSLFSSSENKKKDFKNLLLYIRVWDIFLVIQSDLFLMAKWWWIFC